MSIKLFRNIDESDLSGGKGASLAKMYQNKLNIPNGYVIMADEFDNFLLQNGIKYKIQSIITALDIENEEDIQNASNEISKIILSCDMNENVKNEIIKNYEILGCKFVAVRSSATSEDGKSHAWAGQLESFLNVDKTELAKSVKKCWNSVFSPRAIYYRLKNNDKTDIKVAVVVQKMVQSRISGVAFSINPVNNDTNEIVIESVLGLGEAIVSGRVTPDKYIVNKKDNKIESKEINNQREKIIKDDKENKWVQILDGNIQKLSDEKINILQEKIKQIENIYGFPVDIEWAIEKEEFYILQCRPITTFKENKIKSIIDIVNKIGGFKYYVSRKFNWFLENTQIFASGEEAQDELLGFNIAIKNYLILNGDEYSLDKDFKETYKVLKTKFERDINFFDKFAKKEMDLVEEIKAYMNSLSNKNLSQMNYKELCNELELFNKEYIRSFVPGFTRPEDFLELELKEELKQINLSENEIENIFSKISTCPNYGELAYSEEPLELLKIALEKRNKKNIDSLLNNHIEKYSWIKAPVINETTCFTKDDYIKRLENLDNEDIEAKIENVLKTRKSNDDEYEKILKQYKFPEKIMKLAKAIRDFIYLRTYTTEYSDHLFYIARKTIFLEISKRCKMNVDDLIMLGCEEILDLLKNNCKIQHELRELIAKRRKGFAIIWIDGKIKTFFGNDSLKLQYELGKIYKTNEEVGEKHKNIISGTVANTGKVTSTVRILLEYEDIYKVKKGDIIVATMTTPDYILAMEKASRFYNR